MQAIQTRFLSHTEKRGARVVARCKGGVTTLAWDYELTDEDNHAKAAWALIKTLGWHAAVIEGAGTMLSGDMVFTLKNMY